MRLTQNKVKTLKILVTTRVALLHLLQTSLNNLWQIFIYMTLNGKVLGITSITINFAALNLVDRWKNIF